MERVTGGSGRGDRPALVGPGGSWSYARLGEEVRRRAAVLREDGVRAGMPVTAVVEPDVEGVLALLAIWGAEGVPVPLNARLTAAERTVAERAVADVGHGLPAGARAIVWTSGTSGAPRGVVLTEANLVACAEASRERLGLRRDDVFIASLSPAHVGGLALVFRALYLGGTLLAPGRFDVRTASDWIDGRALPAGAPGPATRISLVPTQLLRLLEHRAGARAPDTLRSALVGGAHAPGGLVARALRAGWPIALTYGATEMSSQIATAAPEWLRQHPGSVGPPMPGVEVRVSPEGEILTRGATLAAGAVMHAPAPGAGISAAAGSGGTLAPLADAEGWYHTGDLGRLDDDGALWVTGRRADRIVTGGVTVDAQEVEEALRGHPAVIEACVVGLDDPEWGEVVGAWVVGVEGELDPDDVTAYLAERLSGPKLPRRWRTGGALPLNANGKVDRARVRAALSRDGGARGPG